MATPSSLHSSLLLTKPPQANANARPMAATANTGTSSDSATNSAAISANDFLTLLVTEMQNQDPTATTDPNEYINQLVQVNSLQQLIQINQTLSSSLGGSPTGTSAQVAQKTQAMDSSSSALHSNANPHADSTAGIPAQHVAGNLTVRDSAPAALRIAQALSGQAEARSAVAGLLPAPAIHPQ